MKCFKWIKDKWLFVAAVLVAFLVLAGSAYVIFRQRSNREITFEKALQALESGEKNEALTELEILHDKDPKDETVAINLAQLYLSGMQYDKTISLKDHDYQSSVILNAIASAYRATGDSENAQIFYEKALDQNPENVNGYVSLAAYYQGQGKLDSALSICENGISKVPTSSKLLVTAASIALKLDDSKKAKAYANQALENEPGNQQAKEILGKVK